jgi:hypothetical protein
MLTKIVVTALIILACFYYLRFQRKIQQADAQKSSTVTRSRKFSLTSQIKWLASGLVVLTVCAAFASLTYGWL